MKAAYYPSEAEMNQFFKANPTSCIHMIAERYSTLHYYEPLATWAISLANPDSGNQTKVDLSQWSTRPYSVKLALRTAEGRSLGVAELEVTPPMTRTLSHECEGDELSDSSDEEELTKTDTK